jgi:hypothetical protein
MTNSEENHVTTSEAQTNSSLPSPSRRKRRTVGPRTFWSLLAVTALIALASGVALYFSYPAYDTRAAELVVAEQKLDAHVEQKAKDLAARNLIASEKKKAEDEANVFASIGYESAGNGLYYRWANPDEFTCGNWACAAVFVTTGSAACSGVYVEANIMSGNMVIGFTNDTVGALGPSSVAGLMLEDYVGGDSFKITQVNCW